jgi:hypothetical protein
MQERTRFRQKRNSFLWRNKIKDFMREQSMIALRQKQVFESMQRSRLKNCDEGAARTPHRTSKKRKLALFVQSQT